MLTITFKEAFEYCKGKENLFKDLDNFILKIEQWSNYERPPMFYVCFYCHKMDKMDRNFSGEGLTVSLAVKAALLKQEEFYSKLMPQTIVIE